MWPARDTFCAPRPMSPDGSIGSPPVTSTRFWRTTTTPGGIISTNASADTETGRVSRFDRYFGITAHGSTVPRELRAGLTTWLTMSYALFLNPQILSEAIPIHNGFAQLVMVTCIAAGFGSLAMGLVARYPFAQAPGMGLNAFFTFTVVKGMGIAWQTALGAVFISGALFVILSVIGARQAIVKAIPNGLKYAITAGIGMFLAFLGLQNAGLVVKDDDNLVGLGSLKDPDAWVAAIGLIITAVLMRLKVKGALLFGILGTTAIAIVTRAKVYPGPHDSKIAFSGFSDGVVAMPVWPSGLFGHLDIGSALGLGIFSVVFTFFFVDFFDATGTLTGLAQRAGYMDENGDMPRAKTTFSMDGAAAMFGAVMGTSTTTAYVESASGIEEGGRTGLTSAFVGLLFGASMFVWPLTSVVPSAATAPVLILVGALMASGLSEIDWKDVSVGVPAFLTILLMPLTYSIANGVSFGLISYCAIKAFSGQPKQVNPVLYLVAALLVVRYIFLST